MSFLELCQLRKTYADGTEAVKSIDFAAVTGEFIVLLGPSGCGKTTTLRMIAGLETPTGGSITIGGRDVTRLSPAERDVGFVFQFYALYPHMTVRQNIAFPLDAVGTKRAVRNAMVEAVAGGMGLGGLLHRYPRQLSGGDQQRVSLARAIVRKPRVWLMDEPLGTLDADQRLGMREFIRARQQEMGVTTVYVTHDQEEAMSLADRIVVMHDGEISQVGPPADVYDQPASLFVASFVGSPGMNFIPGVAQATAFVPEGSHVRIPIGRALPPGPVTLGVRPEYVREAADGPIAGRVVLDEYQGSFRIVHVDAGFAHNLLMRVPAGGGHSARPVGRQVGLGFDPAHTRFFASVSGRSI